jgi:hypothetical protein
MTKSKAIGDMLFSIGLIVVSIIVIWDVGKIPSSMFEPLGASFFPNVVSTMMIATAALILLKALWIILKGNFQRESSIPKEKIWHATILSLSIIAYVAAIDYRLAPFSILTALFLVISISALANFKRDVVIRSIIVGVIMGAACEITFTRFLIMDLPHF